jgi:hypothetical protein
MSLSPSIHFWVVHDASIDFDLNFDFDAIAVE